MALHPEFSKKTKQLIDWARDFEEADLLTSTFKVMQLSTRCKDFSINVLDFMHQCSTESRYNFDDHQLNKRLQNLSSRFYESNLKETHFALVASRNVEALFSGHLETHYLATLCSAKPPVKIRNPELILFIEHLRRWVFITSLFNALSQNCTFEKNAKIAARFLRKTEFTPKEEQLLEQLCNSTSDEPSLDFSTLKLCIIDFRNRNSFDYAEQKTTNGFLNALYNLATSALEPIDKYKDTITADPIFQNDAEPPRQFDFNNPLENLELANADELTFAEPTSYTFQELSEKSIYHIAEEQAAFLDWSSLTIAPPLLNELKAFIAELYLSEDAEQRSAATLLNINIQLARTYLFTENIAISATLSEDWAINPKTSVLHRKRVAFQNWIDPEKYNYPSNPFNRTETLTLSKQDQEAISLLLDGSNVKHLGEAWLNANGIPFSKWLTRLDKRFQNQWSGVRLRNTSAKQYFEKTQNPTQTAVLGFHAGLKLPSTSAYLSFNNNAQRKARDLAYNEGETGEINAAGSTLSVKDSELVQAFQYLNEAIKSKPSSFVECHNIFTTRTVLALLAESGARMVNDPFESLAHFDLDLGAIFVHDKSVHGRGGRLVPLTHAARKHVQNYTKHLEVVSYLLANGELKEQINTMLGTPHHQSSIPLFFFLTADYDWESITPSTLIETMGSATPFYKNTLRHRFAQTASISSHEALKSWLGHQYTSYPHYGVESLRCFKADISALKLTTLIEPVPSNISKLKQDLYTPRCFSEKPFGIVARQQNLIQSRKEIRKKAQRDIRRFCFNKALHELNEDQMSDLITQLTRHPDGRTHHDAALRYDTLIEHAKQVSQEAGKEIVISRRFLRTPKDPVIFEANTLLAAKAYAEMKNEFSPQLEVQHAKKPPSQISPTLSAFLAAIQLSFEHHISDIDLLEDMLNIKNIALHKLKGQFYLVHLAPVKKREAPDQLRSRKRILVSTRLARFINRALERRQPNKLKGYRSNESAQQCFNILQRYQLIKSQSPSELVSVIAYCTKQYNLVHLPGYITAHLDQSTACPPLNTCDWLRTRFDLELIDNAYEVLRPINSANQNKHTIKIGEPKETLNKPELLSNAKAFYRELTSCLKGYDGSDRKATAKALINITKKHDGKVVSTLLWFGYWISEKTLKGKSQREPHKQSTLQTYLSSLGHTLFETAYAENLSTLDTEDREELYAEALEAYLLNNNDAKYFLDRLKNFDAFLPSDQMRPVNWTALDQLPLETPPWACIVRESEYLACLKKLITDGDISAAAMAVLSYRFSLRPIEAAGLPPQDLHFHGNHLQWIDVTRRGTQTLKTNNARRRVVSLFKLDDAEQQILAQAKIQSDPNSSALQSSFLFPDCNTPQQVKAKKSRSANAISLVLRQVTKNPMMSCYALRHSYYNVIFAALTKQDEQWLQIFTSTSSKEIRTKLLGSANQYSEFRSAVALSRLMGHKSLKAGFNNYNHLVPELVANQQPNYFSATTLKNAIDLDESTKPFKASENVSPGDFNHSFVNLLKFIRLLGRGADATASASGLNIDEELAEKISQCLRDAASDMKFAKKSDEKNLRKESQIPARIPEKRWIAIMHPLANNHYQNIRLTEKEQKQIPLMLGKVRKQIILYHQWHFELLVKALSLYKMQPNDLDLSYARKSPQLEKWVEQYRFAITEKRPIDKGLFLNDYGELDQKKNYAVLFMTGRGDTPLKSGFDVFISLVAYAFSEAPN